MLSSEVAPTFKEGWLEETTWDVLAKTWETTMKAQNNLVGKLY